MTTRTSHNVGASNTNPGTAVTPTAGTAVPAPGTVTPHGTPPAGPVPAAPSLATATGVAVVKTFREGLHTQETALAIYLQDPPANNGKLGGRVSKTRIAVIPAIADLLRQFPHLASQVDPDAILAGNASADGLDALAAELFTLATRVKSNARRVRTDTWTDAGMVYAAASYQAKSDPALKGRVAPIRASLQQGPRVESAAAAALAASQQAARTQARAVKAQQKAAVATRRQTRAVQAHADSHPVPASPVPLANPQGPAASADVAPQGPAPGR